MSKSVSQRETALLEVCATFFDYASLEQHKQTIKSMLKAVNTSDYWRKRDPASLLDYHRALTVFIKGVYKYQKHVILPESGIKKQGLAEITDIQEILPVFNAFFTLRSHKKWRKDLSQILHFALSSTDANTLGVHFDSMEIFIELISLIESCHIVWLKSRSSSTPEIDGL